MTRALHLTITTPDALLVDEPAALSVRAEDESGGFGVLPGHADLLTVLPPSVVRWRAGEGAWRYCAVHGGVLTVTGGGHVSIACRRGEVGEDLARLEEVVRAHAVALTEADRQARVEQVQLHARVVRQLVRLMHAPQPQEGPAREEEASP